jgi:hypothetical protein
MSQHGVDGIPLFMEDGQRANSVCRESDHSHEGMSCGLDVEPEVAFREGQKQKDKYEKTINVSGGFGLPAGSATDPSWVCICGLEHHRD